MTTLQETIVGGVIAGGILLMLGYIGRLVHEHYIKKKIESTPDFWSTFWYYTFMLLTCLGPAGTIIYYYLYKPLDKFFVFIVALCIGVIVFIALNSIHTRQVIRARREAIKNTGEIVANAFKAFGNAFTSGASTEKEPKQAGK